MALILLPGLKMIAGPDGSEPGLLGQHAEFHQLGHSKLLVRERQANHHPRSPRCSWLSDCAVLVHEMLPFCMRGFLR